MTERNPDIEIYIKRAGIEDVMTWIATRFDIISQQQSLNTLKLALTFENEPLQCSLVPDVVKGGYMSICFEPNHTPWPDDEACALCAYEHFGLEVRCSTGGWTTTSDDTGGWYRFTDAGRSVVNWLT